MTLTLFRTRTRTRPTRTSCDSNPNLNQLPLQPSPQPLTPYPVPRTATGHQLRLPTKGRRLHPPHRPNRPRGRQGHRSHLHVTGRRAASAPLDPGDDGPLSPPRPLPSPSPAPALYPPSPPALTHPRPPERAVNQRRASSPLWPCLRPGRPRTRAPLLRNEPRDGRAPLTMWAALHSRPIFRVSMWTRKTLTSCAD